MNNEKILTVHPLTKESCHIIIISAVTNEHRCEDICYKMETQLYMNFRYHSKINLDKILLWYPFETVRNIIYLQSQKTIAMKKYISLHLYKTLLYDGYTVINLY